MAEKTIKKKNSKREEITYRIDADFVPSERKLICKEFMENYCVANGEIDWYIETNKPYTNDEGKTKSPNYFTVRNQFVDKFFPAINEAEQKAKELKEQNKKETYYDYLKRKYGK